jgi:Phosphoinositide 3-kinase family, accessory domain (PIK domain)
MYCVHTLQVVRRFAVDALRTASDQELLAYMLQLVQALRYEPVVVVTTAAALPALSPAVTHIAGVTHPAVTDPAVTAGNCHTLSLTYQAQYCIDVCGVTLRAGTTPLAQCSYM